MTGIRVFVLAATFLLIVPAGADGPQIHKLWSYPLETSITADDFVCISGDGERIVAVSEDTKLYMLDADGSLRWNYNIYMEGYYGPGDVSSLSATDDLSRIYVTTESSSNLFILDDGGDLVAEKPLEGEPMCCRVAGDGSKLFVGFDDGRLECYKTGDELGLLWTFFEPVEARPGEILPWRANAINLVAASDDGSVVIVLIGKRQLVILNGDGAVQYKFPAAGDVTTVVVNGAGSVIAAAYMAPDTANGELISLPTEPDPGKAVKPLRRYRFERFVSSVDITDDGKLTFVGLDALSDINFKLLDEKGATLISLELGAAVDKLAASDDGRRFAVLDDIGGENLSYYEYVPEGAEPVVAAPEGTEELEAGTEDRGGAGAVLGDLYLVFAILSAVVIGILILMSVGKRDRRVLRNTRLAAAATIIIGVGSIILGLKLDDGTVVGAGGVFFFVGAGLVVFSIVYKSRAKTDMVLGRFKGIIESRGQVELKWLAKELGVSEKELESLIYDAVAQGQFRGYINWKSGDLYAKSAGEIETNRCPVCGATLEFAGKGVVSCEYCGTETFL